MSSKTLVLGASGFLGSYFNRVENKPLQQFSRTLEHDRESKIQIDPWDFTSMEDVVTLNGIKNIINCIAMANIELCESDPEMAIKVNSNYPHKLARFCLNTGVHLVHVSTDAVFEDSEFPKNEMSQTNPKSTYGKSKLMGEKAVRSISSDFTIARVNFYGFSPKRNSLFDHFYSSLTGGRRALGFSDAIFSPLYVLDTAEALLLLAEKKYAGIINIGGTQSLTKYEFGIKVARSLKLEEDLIVESSIKELELAHLRGFNLGMDNKKMLEIFKPRFSLEQGILDSITHRKRAEM